MKRLRTIENVARFLLIAGGIFTPLPPRASGQIRHHNDSDFKNLEQTVGRQDDHFKHNDTRLDDITARLNRIEGMGECLVFLVGSGLLGGVGTILIKKGKSA